MRTRPGSVFVPYEQKSGILRKIYDLPRFVEPHEVIAFLQSRPDLSRRLLDWREEFDTISINEYMRGIGEAEVPLPELIRFTEVKH